MNTQQVLQSINAESVNQEYKGPIKYTLPDGRIEEIAQWHNPNPIIEKILNHNRVTNLTSILLVGGMGSGKSTLANFLAHQFHTKAGYTVRWFGKNDIQRIDSLIQELEAIPHVLIFDDVSMALRGLSSDRKSAVLSAITKIRHEFAGGKTGDTNVIMIANIHYQNSMEKMYRNFSHYRFFTDLEREDQGVLNKLTDGKLHTKLETFSRICEQQFEGGSFTVSLSANQTKTYETNKPFRICAVLTRRGLSFMLYPKSSCHLCSPENKNVKRFVKPEVLVEEAVKKYDKDATLALKIMCLTKGIRNHMRHRFIYAWDDCQKLLSMYDVDWKDLAKYLRERSQVKESNFYRKQMRDESGKSIGPKDQIELIESVKEKSSL